MFLTSRLTLARAPRQVCFGSCFDADTFQSLQGRQGQALRLKPRGTDLQVEDGDAGQLSQGSGGGAAAPEEVTPGSLGVAIQKRSWCGKWAVSSDEMTAEIVGGKSRNLADLRFSGQLPDDIKLPAQVSGKHGRLCACPSQVVSYV